MPSELIPWRDEIERLRREMDQLCERFFDLRSLRQSAGAGEWYPAVDMSESEGEITVLAEIPGLEGEDIEVTLDGNVLTIHGERKRESIENDAEMYRAERSYGVFSRSVHLPGDVESEGAMAIYRDGILRVRLPKICKKNPRKVHISTE